MLTKGTTNSDFDPEAPGSEEIGREIVDHDTGVGLVVTHRYREGLLGSQTKTLRPVEILRS